MDRIVKVSQDKGDDKGGGAISFPFYYQKYIHRLLFVHIVCSFNLHYIVCNINSIIMFTTGEGSIVTITIGTLPLLFMTVASVVLTTASGLQNQHTHPAIIMHTVYYSNSN